MNHIELFAGCGGLSLGLETAGFDLLFANELSPMASETFAYNHLNIDLTNNQEPKKVFWVSSEFDRRNIQKRLRENPNNAIGLKEKFSDLLELKPNSKNLKRSLLIGSISDINQILEDSKNKELLKNIKSGLGAGGIDVVSGGPPCQSFSLAGLRNLKNERNQLPWEFVKFVKLTQPKIALLENVTGILRAFKDGANTYYAWFEVAKAFAKIGYVPICLHVNAKYVGAAQNRPRFILIALRKDIFENFNTRNKDKILTKALENSYEFFKKSRSKNGANYGTLAYYDVDKDKEFYQTKIFSPLMEFTDSNLFSVKDAINDLESNRVKESNYVKNINSIFENKYNHKLNKNNNHELRKNSSKIQSRFRLYQVLSKLPNGCSKEVLRFLKEPNPKTISNHTFEELSKHWLLSLSGEKIKLTNEKEILNLLKNLETKKHTQRALIADLPAPAALSIPDDGCHYSEKIQRTLTVREMARIQSFPDWFEIKSKVTTGGKMRRFEVPQYTQIGNAVPPLLGKTLGHVCRKIITSA